MNFEGLTNATKAGISKMKEELERIEKEYQNKKKDEKEEFERSASHFCLTEKESQYKKKKLMKELGFKTEREMISHTRILDAESILSRIEYHLWSFHEFDLKRIEDEELRARMTICIEHMLDLVTMYVMDYDPEYMINLTTRERVYYDSEPVDDGNEKHEKGGN